MLKGIDEAVVQSRRNGSILGKLLCISDAVLLDVMLVFVGIVSSFGVENRFEIG